MAETRVKVPLRDTEYMFGMFENNKSDDGRFCVATKIKSKSVIRLKSNRDHMYEVVNSCNGLHCLKKSRWSSSPDRRAPILVCNPVTSEFMYLPKSACVYLPKSTTSTSS